MGKSIGKKTQRIFENCAEHEGINLEYILEGKKICKSDSDYFHYSKVSRNFLQIEKL